MSVSQSIGIAQLADTFGVSHRSLRFYESKSLLNPTRDGTERRYSDADAQRLQLILKGKKLGFSLEEIRRIIRSSADSLDATPTTDATRHLTLAQIETQLQTLEAERTRLDEALIELRSALARTTVEHADTPPIIEMR